VQHLKKTKIAIVRCKHYDSDDVFRAIDKGIEFIGGIDSIIKPEQQVLLKPNNLAGAHPDEAVTTHPTILEGMIRILKKKRIDLQYGDSPGFEKPSTGLRKSGLSAVADDYGVKLADFENGKNIHFPQGLVCKNFPITNACIDADCIISLPKMKTHQLTKITGAVKNQFGCIYGLHKAPYHLKYPDPISFSRMLVDLNHLVRPKLFVMDGVIAMEGNGPRGGTPKNMQCILVSTDPVAMDATFCRMINLDPRMVATNTYGELTKLGSMQVENLEYLGEPIEEFIQKDFVVNRQSMTQPTFKNFITRLTKRTFFAKPVIDPKRCIHCGICVQACPVEGKALQFQNGNTKQPPVYDYANCIRCYCCQEMCPHKAIFLK
jgi:uncharacterized protein (DUF362 family)/NAD-dependent dihydropyrimidine dehydrogenase PreA subunit